MTIAHSRTRERARVTSPVLCIQKYIAGGLPPKVYYAPNEHVERCLDSPHKGPPYTSGSPFEVSRFYLEQNVHSSVDFDIEGFGGTLDLPGREWNGKITHHLLPHRHTFGYTSENSPIWWTTARMNAWANLLKPSDAELNQLGATAWNKFKPGKPLSSSDQAALEVVKDGVPSIPGAQVLRAFVSAKRSLLKAIAGEYLNIEFGWKPIVSDLRAIYAAQQILEKRMSQLRRDNGLPVRRRGSFPVIIEQPFDTGNVHGNFARPSYTTEFYGPAASPLNFKRLRTVRRSKVRFSARFRYWIPELESSDGRWPDRTKLALFGVNPNASLLYEVMPWSWLIDWFTNLGDVIDNMSVNAAENLVADYAYIMKEVDHRDYYIVSVLLQDPSSGYDQLVVTSQSEVGAIFKMRDSANPYGFGFTFDALTWRQKAILAALGLSRSTNG